jgi:UDP-N-acetyl-D-glucosamine dehydrogenase
MKGATDMKQLLEKIENKTSKIGVIGLGYVGLPLAVSFANRGFYVVGYDLSEKKIDILNGGKSPILDVSDESLKKCLNKSFYPTLDYNKLKECDFIIICVPTPLSSTKEPDLSYIVGACETISKILRKGQFIILESTTYPGTTEHIVIPILERTGFKADIDFGVAYSPERIDPGNKTHKLNNVPKVVGGISPQCSEIAKKLYQSIIKDVVAVRDPKTAEAVKMVENIFRLVNIALVNELSLIFEKIGVDTWETINAASTKPYGFMPFYPGPGVGGHCIPLDPSYMSYVAKRHDIIPRFIETAGEINEFMRLHTINLAEKGLQKNNLKIHNSTISIFGMTYKKNIDDVRESPSLYIVKELLNLGANVKVYDPYVEYIEIEGKKIYSKNSIEDALKDSDCVIFTTDHDVFYQLGMEFLEETGIKVIVDCRNIFNKELFKNTDIDYLAIGKDNNI